MALKFGQKLKKLVGTVAPVLGTALGGPLGGVAGKFVQDALGVDTDEAALAQLESNPDSLLKLKQSERDFEIRMRELNIDVERIDADDRANARAREIATKDSTTKVLAYLVVSAFLAMGAAVLFGYALAESTVAGTIIGYVSAKAEQVVAYYFGSSAGSKQKTDLMGAPK